MSGKRSTVIPFLRKVKRNNFQWCITVGRAINSHKNKLIKKRNELNQDIQILNIKEDAVNRRLHEIGED